MTEAVTRAGMPKDSIREQLFEAGYRFTHRLADAQRHKEALCDSARGRPNRRI
jgi:hypothetical protein